MGVSQPLLIVTILLLTSLAGATEMDKTTLADFGLSGHVRQSTEQTTFPADGTVQERSSTSTFVYSPEGRLLESRTRYVSSPDYVTTYTYDTAGRLASKSTSSGSSDADRIDVAYTYDDKGRLLGVNPSKGNFGVTYEYDVHDAKLRVDHLPVFKLEPNTAVGMKPWESSDLAFLPPSGGTVTTVYDEHNRPVEGQVRDADGRLTMRISRTYDAEGRIQGDKLIPEDMESFFSEQLAGQLNDAQKKGFARLTANAYATGESGYKYDSQGRVVEKHRVGGIFGDELTKLVYNDHGDVSEEVTVLAMSPDFGTVYGVDEEGNLVPESKSEVPGPTQNATRYSYEYDSHGNWTRKTTSIRQDQTEFKTSMIVVRTLSYY